MRVSEKTIELNFCAQAQAALGQPIFWFGLTQSQEARAGFDVASRIHGRLVILQFKASNHVTSSGARRFHLQHHQLQALVDRTAIARQRSVFYVFPEIGETAELGGAGWNILSRSWLLDVASLPPIPPPTTRSGALRRNERHYADLSPPNVTIRSDPTLASLVRADEFFSEGAVGADGILMPDTEQTARKPWTSRGAVALLLP